jgi:hypothetical protein
MESKGPVLPLLVRRCRGAIAPVNNEEMARIYWLINQEDATATGWN